MADWSNGTEMDPLLPKQMLEPLRPALSLWLGSGAAENWLGITSALPISSRLFLEFHPTSAAPRCDLITRVLASDGSLSAWLHHPAPKNSAAWQETSAVLRRWQGQLRSREGILRTHCFMMWLEFDVFAESCDIGNPSIFIALTPQADVAELAEDLGDYPDLQAAILDFHHASRQTTSLYRNVMCLNSLTLGHIGYMASRGEDDARLPLRSCWRCDDFEHFYRILASARVPFDHDSLVEQTRWLQHNARHINSLMLHLDSSGDFRSDFSLEVNVMTPDIDLSEDRETALLQSLVEHGFMSAGQRRILLMLRGRYSTGSGQAFWCSLHHIKLKFVGSVVQDVKCYWLIRIPGSI
jgi:hypothetical protein